MRAAKLYGPRDIRIEEIPETEPGPGELLLTVTAVGICGSDLHTYLHWQIGGSAPGGPMIMGHEAAGIVNAVGLGVTDFQVGQRVAIDPAIPCLVCERCLEGDPNLCANLKFMGLWPDQGALREHMTHPARACIPLPDSVSDVGGALLEPLGVALHAINLAKIAMGDDVLITGCGAIGLMMIQLARLAGARHIYASDRYDWRLALAAAYGADTILKADQVDVVAAVIRGTQGRGVDVAIESAWAEETCSQCVEASRNGGRVIIVGIPVEEYIKLRASPARRKGLTIKLSRRMKHSYPRAIALTTAAKIALDPLASHCFGLAQAGEAFETAATYADSVVRAMVLPNKA
ncbi:MAG: alcohol dehydrogenase catalytic domain-containing protein [Chloroflexota bacterium]